MEKPELERLIWELEEQADIYIGTIERLEKTINDLTRAIIGHRLRVMESEKEGYEGPSRNEFDKALWLIPGMMKTGCPAGCPCREHV